MDSNHEAIHMAYTLGLKAVTGRLSPAYRAQWEVATRHIPAEQMQSALDSFGIRINPSSITVPLASFAHTINQDRVVFDGGNYHRNEYMNSKG